MSTNRKQLIKNYISNNFIDLINKEINDEITHTEITRLTEIRKITESLIDNLKNNKFGNLNKYSEEAKHIIITNSILMPLEKILGLTFYWNYKKDNFKKHLQP